MSPSTLIKSRSFQIYQARAISGIKEGATLFIFNDEKADYSEKGDINSYSTWHFSFPTKLARGPRLGRM